jgi:DNA repair photolyase
VENFDTVRGKANEIEILERELRAKRKKGVVGIGAMSDTYNPLEKQHELTRKALTLVQRHGFGVSLETKSDLIVRDADVFTRIDAGVILKFSVTAADDGLASILEPRACASSARFRAMKTLSDAGLFTGTLLSPVIPFITDTEENVREIIRLSRESGAKFVWSMGGVTLRENQREYFYAKLDEHFKGLRERYVKTFGDRYICHSLNAKLALVYKEECQKHGLLYKMPDIIRAYKNPGTSFQQLKLEF